MSYRHKGYNPLKVKQTMTSQQYMEGCSASDTWLESLLCLLKQLNVTLLLVKGRVSPDVQHSCDAAGILIISRVPYQLLEQISTSTQVDLLTNVPLATQTHVCSDLTLSTLASHRSGRVQLVGQSQLEVVLCTPDALFQTVMIFGISPVVCNLRKQEVLNCLHRMTSVLNSSDLFIGEGGFEQTCIKTCERKIDQGERLLSTDDEAGVANVLIARALRDCLLNYIKLPACPSSQLESLSGRIDMHH